MDNKIYVTKPFLPDKKLLDSYIEKISIYISDFQLISF